VASFVIADYDVPPRNDTRYNVVKGGIDGQEGVHTGTNNQQTSRG
jgi:hypothetical protein